MQMLAAWLGIVFALGVWPMYQMRPDHQAVLTGSAHPYTWIRRFGGKINGGIAFDGASLYVESFDRRVTALDASTGNVEWSTRVGNVVMTTPIVANGLVVVGTGTNALLRQTAASIVWGRPQGDAIVALDARSGRIRWRYRTVGEDMPTPALVRVGRRDAIAFANGDDHVRALDLRTGRVLWQHPVAGIATMSSAALHGNRLFVVVGAGPTSKLPDHALSIEAQTGRIVWAAAAGNADCSPTVGSDRVFVEGSSFDPVHAYNNVAAIDEQTGKLHWRWYSGPGAFSSTGSDEEGIAGLAADGAFYESIPTTRQFIAFDAATGRVRWQLRTPAPVKMSAVEWNGNLYFGDTGGTLYVVSAKSARVVSRKRFPPFFTTSPPVIVGSTLYIANDKVLRAIPLTSLSTPSSRP